MEPNQEEISKWIRYLYLENKKKRKKDRRSREQIAAIAYSKIKRGEKAPKPPKNA